MKFSKKTIGMLFALSVLMISMLLSSCVVSGGSDTNSTASNTGTDADTESADVTPNYTVSVVDAFGAKVPNVVVKLMQGDGMAAMSATDDKGVASFKYNTGEYTVAIDFTGGDKEAAGYYYDISELKLNKDTPAQTVTVYKKITDFDRFLKGTKYYDAGKVGDGAYYVDLAEDDMTYFVFRPTRAGVYKVGFISSTKIEIGYYGDPINVTDNSLIEVVDNQIELVVRNINIGETEDTTSPYVIGLKSRSADQCILTIERVGDPEKTAIDDTWKEIHATSKYLVQQQTEAGKVFTPLDLKAANLTVVLNEEDGYYHVGTKDGPLVYVLITEPSSYCDVLPSFIGQLEVSALGVYFYDGEGNYLRKELYNEMFQEYAEICNSDGACPLTEELATAIKNLGDFRGWWNFPSQDIFGDNLYPVANAWLFACGYYA